MLCNAYATCRELPPLEFEHTLRARRDRGAELTEHLRGFMGYVTQRGTRAMSMSIYHVLRHLDRVRHHLALETDDLDGFEAWCVAANAIVFLPDGSVRASDGSVLVHPTTGEAEDDADLPYPEDARARKAVVDDALAARGIAVPATLPPAVSALEVELRTPAEVAARCLALLVCAVRAESLGAGQPIAVADLKKRMPLAFGALTPVERGFLDDVDPQSQAVIDHAWRYEALAALVWSLELVGELPWPTEACDVRTVVHRLRDIDAAEFVRDARLRDVGEILDALDLTYRLHWAVTDARVREEDAPAGLDGGVIRERHHALNWLTRFEDAAWDDVQTPT